MKDMTNLDTYEVGYDIPAKPGMDAADIQTPALVLDLDALERNIKKMGDYAKAHGMRHRVHGKMHKSVDVAKLQEKSITLTESIFRGLSSWQISQLSRHPKRPYMLDYIKRILTECDELHGDRAFDDAPAIIGGRSAPEAHHLNAKWNQNSHPK